MTYTPPVTYYWPLWRRIVFRFFFVYLLFMTEPWTWLVEFVSDFYYQAMDWAVQMANKYIFHVRPELVPPNGSGDTSWNWTQIWLLLSVSLIACIVWSILDRKRTSYTRLNYWTCLFTRYFVIKTLLTYGIIKLFALQMPFPNLSQLATPLGDFLPMRLSWMFIGYSQPYQFFSGAMEVIAALLLLYRRTATLGVIMACGVFMNVMIMNLSYDIPVKIYSTQLFVLCLFLLANEFRRIFDFFVLNRNANAGTMYHFPYSGKKIKIARIVLKIAFVIRALVLPFESSWSRYRSQQIETNTAPLKKGVYDVQVYAVNNDTIPALVTDSLRWQEIIFDKSWQGSMRTADTSFPHRYGRAYFSYGFDSTKQFLLLKKNAAANTPIISFRYQFPNDSTILLWGKRNNDSLFLSLKRSKRHFQLAEKQFHALSEYNR